jgi:hypothetical protein
MDQTLKHDPRSTVQRPGGRRDGAPPAGARAKPRDVETKQEFSLAHLTVMGCPPPEMIYVAARAGKENQALRTIVIGQPGEP